MSDDCLVHTLMFISSITRPDRQHNITLIFISSKNLYRILEGKSSSLLPVSCRGGSLSYLHMTVSLSRVFLCVKVFTGAENSTFFIQGFPQVLKRELAGINTTLWNTGTLFLKQKALNFSNLHHIKIFFSSHIFQFMTGRSASRIPPPPNYGLYPD